MKPSESSSGLAGLQVAWQKDVAARIGLVYASQKDVAARIAYRAERRVDVKDGMDRWERSV